MENMDNFGGGKPLNSESSDTHNEKVNFVNFHSSLHVFNVKFGMFINFITEWMLHQYVRLELNFLLMYH